MECQRSKCIESINQSPYNIPPLPGSVQFVLVSPDTEKAPQTLPISKMSAGPFLYEDLPRSGHKDSVEQLSMRATTYQKLSPIAPVLPRTVGALSCSLFAQAWDHRNACCSTRLPVIDRISEFQVHGIHLDTVVQYFPNRWVLPTCSDISKYRNTPQNSGWSLGTTWGLYRPHLVQQTRCQRRRSGSWLIVRIWLFQVHGIHLDIFTQYFPRPRPCT
jgi:hypothetical protein